MLRDIDQTPRRRIGELLIEAGLISEAQLAKGLEAQKAQGGKIVEILVSLGFIEPHQFTAFLAKQRGIPSIDLQHYEVPKDIVSLVPKEFAHKHEVFPVDKMGSLLTVAMVCPLDANTLSELQQTTGLRIKPMLCRPAEIRDAIVRYYPMDDGAEGQQEHGYGALAGLSAPLKLSGVVRMIQKITTLPALPETVEQVQQAATDLNISIQDVARIVRHDPAIAAKVLSVANSSAYGFPNRVDSVELAISLMGLRETYSIVLASAVVDLFTSSKVFDYKAFWKESSRCAVAALVLGPVCDHQRRSLLFCAGLLHAIGRVALSQVAPDLYGKVNQSLHSDELIAQEEEVIGIAHPEAGYELAVHWNLPPEIAQAIRHYHRPDQAEAYKNLVAVISVAQHFTQASSATDVSVLDRCGNALVLAGIDRATAEACLREYFEKRESIDLYA